MQEVKDLLQLLGEPCNVVITSHRNPDGDAVGSCLALKYILEKKFFNVKVALPSEFPDVLAWMTDADDILVYDREKERVIEAIEKADIVFCLDFNTLSRIDKMGEAIAASSAKIVMIDHHLYPDNFAHILISDPEGVSSTCELLFVVFKEAGWLNILPSESLDALLVGLITDTGSFKFSIRTKTLSHASEIVALGGDIEKVQDRLNNHQSEKWLKLLGHCLSKRMIIYPEKKAGLIYLTKKDYIDFNILRGDTEGIVNYLLQLDVVHVAGFITEQPTIIKVSLRSKGNFSVQQMASEYYKGGGHKNASGGSFYGSLKQAISLFEEAIDKYKVEIIQSY
ncbi:MAG: DHH family phosphoesterase [Saprospiraceae bacterium]|nr:DHH family phosphoesterase [Saprospiraceae bacterium]